MRQGSALFDLCMRLCILEGAGGEFPCRQLFRLPKLHTDIFHRNKVFNLFIQVSIHLKKNTGIPLGSNTYFPLLFKDR
uniref:Uncharacterized protein n=1 Tax=Anguilla anguilla TaxID=7936 RepID=A0A0E9XEE9_ANGAN